MLPAILGMQFLTNAFFLPYLISRDVRSGPPSANLYDYSNLTLAERISESKWLPVLLGLVGTISITWIFIGRPEFGDLNMRSDSYLSLVSNDRLAFSFLVDLIYYSILQGWLVDDDLNRRQRQDIDSSTSPLSIPIAKYFPLFGLVHYFLFRPSLRTQSK